jgi:hypothetical protein
MKSAFGTAFGASGSQIGSGSVRDRIICGGTAMQPRWLKLKDASEYASLGQKRLVQLALDGVIRGFKDPDSGRSEWIFDRISIDEYRMNQADPAKEKAKVLKLMEGVQ